MESINRQLKRRTNVISIFPSEASLLRMVTAKAMDLSDEWEGISGKSYISPEKFQLAAEALQAASSQPQHPAERCTNDRDLTEKSLRYLLGHNERMLVKHYRRAMTKEESEELLNITPRSLGLEKKPTESAAHNGAYA